MLKRFAAGKVCWPDDGGCLGKLLLILFGNSLQPNLLGKAILVRNSETTLAKDAFW